MPRNIAVTSNCLTGGLSAALQALLPSDIIHPISGFGFHLEGKEKENSKIIKNCDAWVCIDYKGLVDVEMFLERYSIDIHTVMHPQFHFAGFFPDQCYAKISSSGEFTPYHYNSAIASWSYRNKLDVDETVALFNDNVMRALGYYDAWQVSVDCFKTSFIKCDLEFYTFFNSIKRNGCFMYSINHPKPVAIIELAKLIASTFGVNADLSEEYIVIGDGLFESVWPVYPEIGYELALPGAYRFKIKNHDIVGIRQYILHSFNAYREWGIDPSDLLPIVNMELYDSILGSAR